MRFALKCTFDMQFGVLPRNKAKLSNCSTASPITTILTKKPSVMKLGPKNGDNSIAIAISRCHHIIRLHRLHNTKLHISRQLAKNPS